MRTRAQGLLSDDEEQGIAGAGNHKSPQGLIKKIKLKISNGRYSRGSEGLKEPPAAAKRGGGGEALKIVLKRKAAQEPQEALVIKKHKRGIRRQRVHEQEEEEEEQEKSEPDSLSRAATAAKIKVKGSGRAGENASILVVAAEEVRGGVQEEQEAGGGDGEKPLPVVTTTEVAAESAGQFCTVNTEMVAERSEASLSSEPSCSADSKSSRKRQAEDDPAADNGLPILLKASRTPMFVPAKRSPLPLPPPGAAAATSLVVAAQVAAVRSALPAPPAVRSALPVPCETASGGDDKIVMDEVDIHGFSSAVTGPGVLPPVQDGSSEEDGFSLPEDEMLSSSMFFGNPWHDDGSLQEMRKRGGPGSRATYRCSRCLAPKKGHRCPFESESPGEDTKTDAVPKLGQKRASITTSNELLLLQNGEESQSPETTTNQDDGPVFAEDTPKVETAKAGKTKPAPDPVVKEFTVSSKWLLESGVLEGHAVRYMPRPGEVLGTGSVKNGVILCNCRHCKGHQGFNASSFEKHVGSTARHPSDFIFLENGRRLRDILEDGSRFRDKPNMMGALRTAVSMDWDASC